MSRVNGDGAAGADIDETEHISSKLPCVCVLCHHDQLNYKKSCYKIKRGRQQ